MSNTSESDRDSLQADVDARQTPEVIPPGGSALDQPTGAGPTANGTDGSSGEPESDVLAPAKVIRIGAMLKQLLEEARNTEVDEAAREQLSGIYSRSVEQLKSALSPDLGEELGALSFDFAEGAAPTESELRMAQAQLVGWLEGLFHGIQAMMMAQQMAARGQLEGMRPGPEPSGPPSGPGYI